MSLGKRKKRTEHAGAKNGGDIGEPVLKQNAFPRKQEGHGIRKKFEMKQKQLLLRKRTRFETAIQRIQWHFTMRSTPV